MQLRADMQRLHFDLVWQLHQQHMEAQEMFEALLQRQDGMEQRIAKLHAQVARLLQIRQGMLDM
jgi:hypothetical protein